VPIISRVFPALLSFDCLLSLIERLRPHAAGILGLVFFLFIEFWDIGGFVLS
jgi:hypothetical protein